MDMARAEQAVQEAAQLRQHQEQLQGQQVQLAEEQPEFMAIQRSVSSSEEDCSSVASGSLRNMGHTHGQTHKAQLGNVYNTGP